MYVKQIDYMHILIQTFMCILLSSYCLYLFINQFTYLKKHVNTCVYPT